MMWKSVAKGAFKVPGARPAHPGDSELLGYAEASAFHHAFKRWTGMSPEQSRRGHRAAG